MSDNLRSLMPGLKNKFYFNYGGQGPLPSPSLNKITQSWQKIQELGPFTSNVWPYINKEIIKTKQQIAEQFGVKPKYISLSENISTGMILPLWGINIEKDDELLISDCEHPGVVAASREFCRRNNLKFRIFPIQKIKNFDKKLIINELGKYINKNTKIFIISHILWNFGYEMPLKEISIELDRLPKKPFLLVDGAQSFGHIDINEKVKFSDVYAVTSHKWACGPEGLGAFYVSERFIKNSNPTIIGWKSLKREQGIYEPHENLFHNDARKFEIATSCIPLLTGLRQSISLIEKDCSGFKKHNLITSMSNKLWNHLKEIDKVNLIMNSPIQNGIVSFDIKEIDDKNNFVYKLGLKNIWIRVIEDPQWFRVCIHQMTTEDEIELLVDEIKSIIL